MSQRMNLTLSQRCRFDDEAA